MTEEPPREPPDLDEILAAMALPPTPVGALDFAPGLPAFLAPFDRVAVATVLAGLMTSAALQAHGSRLDWALRLALSYARGKRKVRRPDIDKFLNVWLPQARVAQLEDPIEEFFAETIPTLLGNFLIFTGRWPNAAFHTECVLRAFSMLPEGGPKSSVLRQAYSLLALSDALARRAGIDEAIVGDGNPMEEIPLPLEVRLKGFQRRTRFTRHELSNIGININDLEPFFLSEQQLATVASYPPGDAPLDFHPLRRTDSGLIVLAPFSITTAVRGLLIQTAITGGLRKALSHALLEVHRELIQTFGFTDIEGPVSEIEGACIMRQAFYELSAGRYVHLVQLIDTFPRWPMCAFGTLNEYPASVGNKVVNGIRDAKAYMEKLPGYVEGMTLLILGGWGGHHEVEFDRAPDLANWVIVSLEPADAMILSGCENGKLLDIWRMHKQMALVEHLGFELFCVNGPLNLFQWWRDTDYALVPPREFDMHPPLTINFDLNRNLKARREAHRALDRKAVPYDSTQFKVVTRFDRRTVERDLSPIYVSTDDVRQGRFLGVITHDNDVCWLQLITRQGKRSLNSFETWKAATKWLELILGPFLDAFVGGNSPIIAHLELEIADADNNDPHAVADSEIQSAVTLALSPSGRAARVTLEKTWQYGLYRVDNRAEKLLAKQLLAGIVLLVGVVVSSDDLERLIDAVVPSDDVRWRHVFAADDPITRLAVYDLIGEFHSVPDSAGALAKCGVAWFTRERSSGSHVEGKIACADFLRGHSDYLFSRLRSHVRAFDRKALICAALQDFQAAMRYQAQWRLTARAFRSIVGAELDAEISLEHIMESNAVIRAATIVTEIASTEAPQESGLQAGRPDLDEIYAEAMLYFNAIDMLAALHGDQMDPKLSISPTGEVLYDHSFERVLHSATENYHNLGRARAVTEYVERFVEDDQPGEPSRPFLEALKAEYGADAQVFVNLPFAMVQLAVEKKEGVFALRRSELIERLSAIDGVQDARLPFLIDRLTLPSRSGWNDLPPGTIARDFDLGKFDRRFSIVGRPIIALDASSDPVLVIAPAILERTMQHNLSGADTGSLQNEFWSSSVMRRHASERGRITGLEFNERVAADIRALGLRAWPSAKPSWCLNRKATEALKQLGDIDVLAVTGDGKIVWVIEAKDLKLCRTRGETASRLSEYRGQMTTRRKPDNMMKHLYRVEFLRAHSAELIGRLGLSRPPERVCGAVVVHAPQPMEHLDKKVSVDGHVVMLDRIGTMPWADGWPD